MPAFGQKSTARLATCDPRLVTLFTEVVKGYDCVILEGARSVQDELANIAKGTSKLTDPMHSKHVVDPVTRPLALAVDASPFPVDWANTERFVHFAGYVLAHAHGQGIGIRWGGAWSGTRNKPGGFDDLVHFELQDA